MQDTTNYIAKSVIATGTGWAISMTDVETTLRIISLVVPTVLSVLLYIKKMRKDDDKTT